MRPVVAAENYDVVSFARAMNDDFAPRVKKLFDPERKAAVEAQKTGAQLNSDESSVTFIVYLSFQEFTLAGDCQVRNLIARE